jgi:hypothetical protein
MEVRSPHALDLYFEDLLDGILDLYLICVAQNLESNSTEVLFNERALFRNHREF